MTDWKCEQCGSTKKGHYSKVCGHCYAKNRWEREKDVQTKEFKQRYAKNKERIKAKNLQHYYATIPYQRKKAQKWYVTNKDYLSKYSNEYTKKRYANDPEFRAKANLRAKTRHSYKKDKACSLCGATENLQVHHKDYSENCEMITVCKSCHYGLHNKKVWDKQRSD